MKALAAIITLITAGGLVLQSDEPPTTRVLNCTEGGCHAQQLEFEFLHGPVAASACEMCHVYDNPARHTFELKREGASLCDFCHIGKTDQAGLHVHEPVTNGECLACHDPHGAAARTLLRSDSPGDTCMECHQGIIDGLSHVHTPVQDGACLDCHMAHSSLLPKLLVEEGQALCLNCHADVISMHQQPGEAGQHTDDPEAIALPAHIAADYLHEPAIEDCSGCHAHHASNEPGVLTQPAKPLCISCHEDVADRIAGVAVPHSVVSNDRACLHCHAPHQSNFIPLLHDDPVQLCMNCHAEEVARTDGSIVPAATDLAGDHVMIHKPLEDGCRACHDSHGAEHRALLLAPYSEAFYEPPNTAAYELCFSCHESAMMVEPTTTSVTAFRDGDVNLHFVHVSQQGDKGRSCRTCHDTHASKSPRLLQGEVPFGKWRVPIEFQETETGGTCAAGCHKERTYSRDLAD